MAVGALFGLSFVLSLIAFGIVTRLYIWPQVRSKRREDVLIALLVPHAFRFVGLSFLVPGVVSPTLSPSFSHPAAYGDLAATLLAIAAILGIAARASWGVPVAWAFNVWGTVDLLNAIYLGQVRVRIDPGSLGAAFFIPTVVVPALLITHGLIFFLLLRRQSDHG